MLTLILLPGLDGTGLFFQPLIAALKSEVDIKIIDYPKDKILDYTELELKVRELFPGDKPYVLLGESFSGPIAISLAASQPKLLKGIILCCSFSKNPYPFLAGLRHLLNFFPLSLMPKKFIAKRLMGKFYNASQSALFFNGLFQNSDSTIRERIKSVLSVDVTEKLKQIQIPILYLQALQDKVVPKSATELVLKIAPHTQLIKRDAPHLFLQTIPLESAAIILDFLKAIVLNR